MEKTGIKQHSETDHVETVNIDLGVPVKEHLFKLMFLKNFWIKARKLNLLLF